MIPSERRPKLVRLLATIDQLAAEAESLAASPGLNDEERQYVADMLKFRRKSMGRVEAMLGAQTG